MCVELVPLMQPGILIIEEDHQLAEELSAAFRSLGHTVHLESDGNRALQAARNLEPSLILMEIELQGLDGLQICRELRADQRLATVPVVIVTSRCSEMDQIAGLSQGADDYMTKPVSIPLLIHRVNAILRRTDLTAGMPERLSHLSIEMNRRYHTITVERAPVELTPTEFLLLWTMMARPGRPFGRNELMEYARGQNSMALERTVDVHIRSLRQKLGSYGKLVETVRGIGYRIAQS
ncbi:MAG: response regulator transcription factor [Planctomycetia bacterium]